MYRFTYLQLHPMSQKECSCSLVVIQTMYLMFDQDFQNNHQLLRQEICITMAIHSMLNIMILIYHDK